MGRREVRCLWVTRNKDDPWPVTCSVLKQGVGDAQYSLLTLLPTLTLQEKARYLQELLEVAEQKSQQTMRKAETLPEVEAELAQSCGPHQGKWTVAWESASLTAAA